MMINKQASKPQWPDPTNGTRAPSYSVKHYTPESGRRESELRPPPPHSLPQEIQHLHCESPEGIVLSVLLLPRIPPPLIPQYAYLQKNYLVQLPNPAKRTMGTKSITPLFSDQEQGDRKPRRDCTINRRVDLLGFTDEGGNGSRSGGRFPPPPKPIDPRLRLDLDHTAISLSLSLSLALPLWFLAFSRYLSPILTTTS